MIVCILTESRCYKAHQPAFPIGIVVHSTGANNPWLKRYVQPSKDDPDRAELLAILGVNKSGNSWNRDVKKSAHYMIGKRADGKVDTTMLLPEDYCAWGVGTGTKGSYNYNPTAHIQFEVCEDALVNEEYFLECYHAAVELCADICRRYAWEADVIVSHHEAHELGYASNHKDIDHWLSKFGKTMDDFRADVDLLLHPEKRVHGVGDRVRFTGKTQYRNANAIVGKKASPCVATVKEVYRPEKARHPYLLQGTGIYGWASASDIE